MERKSVFPNPRQVAHDRLDNGWSVSTVLLTSGTAFETMVFNLEGEEVTCRETVSRNQALINHDNLRLRYCTTEG